MMRKITLIAATTAFALAACQASEEPAAPAEEETAPAEPAYPVAPDGLPAYGVFKVTSADGERTIMQNIKQDGTVINVVAGEDPMPGTWMMDADNNFCITMEGETEADCYADATVDGVWTATNIADPEDAWTVERVQGSEALPEG